LAAQHAAALPRRPLPVAAANDRAATVAGAAPADEYFGRTRLSPLGVRGEVTRIGRYLDAGWGAQMTQELLYVIESLDDWRHQYPRDYELPRLLLQTYGLLTRAGSTETQAAAVRLRRILTVEYVGSPEARRLLAS
jgi:hypothetical protein